MARASELDAPAEDTPAPPTAPQILKCCGTCRGWRALNAMPSMGMCLPSGRAGGAPIVTPDLSGCTAWPAEAFAQK